MTPPRTFRRREGGQAAIEFALVLPLLLLIMLGLTDVGRAVWSSNILSSATREATRYAVVHGAGCSGSLGFGRPLAAPFALPLVASVSVSTQSGTLSAGTAGSATFTVTVTQSGTNNFNVNLTTSALPTGALASFSPNPVDFNPSNATKTSTLTITTTAATPPGAFPFTVTATNAKNSSDSAVSSAATLTVSSKITSVTVGPTQTGTVIAGTGGTVTFQVTVVQSNPPRTAFTVNFSVANSSVGATGTGSVSFLSTDATTASKPGTLTVTVPAGAPAGTSQFTVTGTSSLNSSDSKVSGNTGNLTVTAGKIQSVEIAQTSTAWTGIAATSTSTVTVAQTGGQAFSASLSAPAVLPPGASSLGYSPSSTLTFASTDATKVAILSHSTAATLASGSYPYSVTATNPAATGDKKTGTGTLTVTSKYLSLSAGTQNGQLNVGTSAAATFTVTVVPQSGAPAFTTNLTATIPSGATGMTATFSPPSLTLPSTNNTSTLTINTNPLTPSGNWLVTIKAADASPSVDLKTTTKSVRVGTLGEQPAASPCVQATVDDVATRVRSASVGVQPQPLPSPACTPAPTPSGGLSQASYVNNMCVLVIWDDATKKAGSTVRIQASTQYVPLTSRFLLGGALEVPLRSETQMVISQ